MPLSFRLTLIALGICALLLLLYRFGLYANRKGWISYRKRTEGSRGGGLIGGMLELERALTPPAVHRTNAEERTGLPVKSYDSDGNGPRPRLFSNEDDRPPHSDELLDDFRDVPFRDSSKTGQPDA